MVMVEAQWPEPTSATLASVSSLAAATSSAGIQLCTRLCL